MSWVCGAVVSALLVFLKSSVPATDHPENRLAPLEGLRARASYRPNDRSRPTVCLVHGINSSSAGFIHLIPQLEQAGYGVVVYDYDYNQKLGTTCERFREDWHEFRRNRGETLPWGVIAHSMGALLARSLVETQPAASREAASLILIAPVNQGAHLARLQTLVQLVTKFRSAAVTEQRRSFERLTDSIGKAAADDMLPGSQFLQSLNQRPRAQGVRYHILSGDRGFLTQADRREFESRLTLIERNAGLLGKLTRLAADEIRSMLDELSDGTGDGCVALERTRLSGVTDQLTIHANHAELIRAPLLYPDPGPVACMPHVLRWLQEDMTRGSADRH